MILSRKDGGLNMLKDIKDAKEIILKARKNFRVLSSWIDTYDGANNKITVFHECYVNFIGKVERPKEVDD